MALTEAMFEILAFLTSIFYREDTLKGLVCGMALFSMQVFEAVHELG